MKREQAVFLLKPTGMKISAFSLMEGGSIQQGIELCIIFRQ
jgi:hypothetical protein